MDTGVLTNVVLGPHIEHSGDVHRNVVEEGILLLLVILIVDGLPEARLGPKITEDVRKEHW